MARNLTYFRFGGTPRNYGALVQRWAVLYAIYRPPDAELVAEAGNKLRRTLVVDDWVRRYTSKLVKRRRLTWDRLAAHGWPPQDPGTSPDEEQLRFDANCYPTFAIASPITRACTKSQICPFCYARDVRKIWERVDAAIPNPRMQEEEPCPDEPPPVVNYADPATLRHLALPWNVEERDYPSHLVERRAEFFLPFTDLEIDRAIAAAARIQQQSQYDDHEQRPAEWVSHVTAKLRQTLHESAGVRYTAVSRLKPQAAYLFTVVEPNVDCWHVEQRQLFLVAKDHRIEEQLPPIRQGAIIRHEKPTRRVIAEAVARVCAYPRRWLFDDLSLTAIILNARKSVRTSALYGAFRMRNH